MIILAAAIILSLNSSRIINRANKAKNSSNIASVKEYINTLQAEWDVMSEDQRKGTKCNSSTEYVNKKLEEGSYDRRLTKDEKLITVNAKKALEEGLEIGDVVEYTVTSNTKKSEAANNRYDDQDVSNKTDFAWRYIGINDDGEIMIAPDVTREAPKLYLKGATGYLKGPEEINRLCEELYTTDKGTARSMTIEDVNKLLGYTGEKGAYYAKDSGIGYTPAESLSIQQIIATKGEPNLSNRQTPDGEDNIETYPSDYYEINKESDVGEMTYPEHKQYVYYGVDDDSYCYWLASYCVYANFFSGRAGYCVRCVGFSFVNAFGLFGSGGKTYSEGYALRAVVSLKSDVQLKEVSDGNWKLN